MKKIIFPAMMLLAIMPGCQKDEVAPQDINNTNTNINANTNQNQNNNNQNSNNQNNNNQNNNNQNNNTNNGNPDYTANEALITSYCYVICDVEGIGSMTKLNLQASNNTCDYHWGSRACSAGFYEFNSKCTNLSSEVGTDMVVTVAFRGACPACGFADLVKEGGQHLEAEEESFMGASLSLWFIDGDIYYSSNVESAQQKNDEIEVVTISGTTGKWVKVHFNCTMKTADGSKTIHLKNGVFRSKIL